MVLEYPSTCMVELPLSATAFYNLSQAPAFCSFVAEVTPLSIEMHHCCRLAEQPVTCMHAQCARDEDVCRTQVFSLGELHMDDMWCVLKGKSTFHKLSLRPDYDR